MVAAPETWGEQFATHPGSPGQDADDDTFTNYEEFLFGTQPLEHTASLMETTRDGGTLVIRWNEFDLGGINYALEQSDLMTPGSWGFANFESLDLAEDQEGLPEGYVRYEFLDTPQPPVLPSRPRRSQGTRSSIG